MNSLDSISRFSKTFTTLESTLFHVADYWFTKDPNRVHGMRPDTLGNLRFTSRISYLLQQ